MDNAWVDRICRHAYVRSITTFRQPFQLKRKQLEFIINEYLASQEGSMSMEDFMSAVHAFRYLPINPLLPLTPYNLMIIDRGLANNLIRGWKHGGAAGYKQALATLTSSDLIVPSKTLVLSCRVVGFQFVKQLLKCAGHVRKKLGFTRLRRSELTRGVLRRILAEFVKRYLRIYAALPNIAGLRVIPLDPTKDLRDGNIGFTDELGLRWLFRQFQSGGKGRYVETLKCTMIFPPREALDPTDLSYHFLLDQRYIPDRLPSSKHEAFRDVYSEIIAGLNDGKIEWAGLHRVC